MLEAVFKLCGVYHFHTPMSSTIILSKPDGPKEDLMTLAIACVARTARNQLPTPSNGKTINNSTYHSAHGHQHR
jgi:hypothetical protein